MPPILTTMQQQTTNLIILSTECWCVAKHFRKLQVRRKLIAYSDGIGFVE